MKQVLYLYTIFAIMFSTPFASAAAVNSIQWNEYSPDVVQQAKTAKRTVLIYAMSSSCEWCVNMKNNTFTSPDVIKMVNENYYPVILHADVDIEARKKFHLASVPTLVFLSSNGSVIKMYSGYVEPATTIKYLTEMLS